MRLYFPILFLTLVLSGLAANAAPTNDLQPNPIEMSPKQKGEDIFSVGRVERDWSARVGFLSGAISELNKTEQFPIFGVRYDLSKNFEGAWQVEAMLGKASFVHLVAAKKTYFPLERWMMPYFRYGVGDSVDFTDGLGSVLNIKCIQAVGAVGIDDIFEWEQRLQAEVALSYALIGLQFEVTFGYAF
jgi:hypothetical protein